MSTYAYRVMTRMVRNCEDRHSVSYEAAMTLTIALKIGVTHTDDMVVAQTAKYLVKEELKDHDNDPYMATMKCIARMADKVLNDMENEEFKLEGESGGD